MNIKKLNEAFENLMKVEPIKFKLGDADVIVTNSTDDNIAADEIKKVIQDKNPAIFFNDNTSTHYIMDFSFDLNGKKYWIESTHIAGDFSTFNFNIYNGANNVNESLNEIADESLHEKERSLHDIWKEEMKRQPMVETPAGVIYLQPSEDGKFIQYGTVTNTGMIVDGEVEYDFDFSLDRNIQDVVDEIFEKYGYPLDESIERY